MKKVLIATTICTAMLASCGQNSAEYKKLKAENDSLRIENTKSNAEMDEILGTLNDVEADIQSIRDAENYLNIQQQKGDLKEQTADQRTGRETEKERNPILGFEENNQPPFFRT